MKVGIALTPLGSGRWSWTVGRAAGEPVSGMGDSYEEARDAAESAAVAYEEDSRKVQSYVFDTKTGDRTEA